MNVDFNNLRKQALYSYHRLTESLNGSINKETGMIEIDPDDIQEDMDDLRSLIFSIACCFEEGEEKFKDLSEEVGEIAWFNDKEEQ